MRNKTTEWILRIGVAGEFIGHGSLALQKKADWVGWIHQLLKVDIGLATNILLVIGATDLLIALIVLIKPVKPILLWAAIWGFWTALLRPIVGQSVLDFIERWTNWAAPLALFFLVRQKK